MALERLMILPSAQARRAAVRPAAHRLALAPLLFARSAPVRQVQAPLVIVPFAPDLSKLAPLALVRPGFVR